MLLIVCALAAVAATVAWWLVPRRGELRLDVLALMLWGATLMWAVDAAFDYAELGPDYFTEIASSWAADLALAAGVCVLALAIWLGILLMGRLAHARRAGDAGGDSFPR